VVPSLQNHMILSDSMARRFWLPAITLAQSFLRLTGDIINDAAHSVNLVYNPICNALEKRPRELKSFRSHKIGSCDSPKDNDIPVDTLVSHDSHGTTWIKCGEGLGDLIVQFSLANLENKNMIGAASNLDLFRSHFAQNSNSNPGTRKWSASKISINLPPMNFRFFSGSSMPFNPFRNCCEASTTVRLIPKCSERSFCTCSHSLSLMTPSTRVHQLFSFVLGGSKSISSSVALRKWNSGIGITYC